MMSVRHDYEEEYTIGNCSGRSDAVCDDDGKRVFHRGAGVAWRRPLAFLGPSLINSMSQEIV
jgi:hypothetical protein